MSDEQKIQELRDLINGYRERIKTERATINNPQADAQAKADAQRALPNLLRYLAIAEKQLQQLTGENNL